MSILRRIGRRLTRPFGRADRRLALTAGLQAVRVDLTRVRDTTSEISERVGAAAFFAEAGHDWSKATYDAAESAKHAALDLSGESGRRLAVLEDMVTHLNSAVVEFNSLVLNRIGEARKASIDVADRVDAAIRRSALEGLVGQRLTDVDAETAAFLNYSRSHLGPLRDANLWLNNPVVLEWFSGGVRVGAVNERIVEHPYVFAAIGRLPTGSRILDVGGGESTVALSLASMGYKMTVLEPQGYPFSHPNLTLVEDRLENFEPADPFDGAVVLSAIEHFGVGAYGNPVGARDDLAAMKHLRGLLRPEGTLVLTTPFGPPELNDLERIYDDAGIVELLEDWVIDDLRIVGRIDRATWTLELEELQPPDCGGKVVMVTAHPSA